MNFDRVAPFYQTLEAIVFGNALQRARIRWLRAMSKPGKVLIVGEGDGRFVRELLNVYPGLEIDCVDASAAMLTLVKARFEENPGVALGVRFFQCDIREWTPVESYDLIVTHFVLDCFEAEDVKVVVKKLAAAATSNARWLLADFQVPEKRFAQMHAKFWLKVMYSFFRVTAGLGPRELVDPTQDLRARGFVCQSREVSRFGLLKSERWVLG